MKKGVREPDSPSHLTEFAPLSEEEREPSSAFFWTKFFKRRKYDIDGSSMGVSTDENPVGDSPVGLASSDQFASEIIDEPTSEMNDGSSNESSTEQSKSPSSNGWDAGRQSRVKDSEFYPRSISTVLKRMSNILERRLTTPYAFKDTDFKQYWMPDEDCKECYDCGEKFTTFRRRHHCRVCGQIFCSRCCNQEIPGKIIGCPFDLRVCKYCCKVVLSYVQLTESDVSVYGSTSDLRCLQEDLQSKLSLLDNQSDSSTYDFGHRGTIRRKNSLEIREQSFVRSRKTSSIDPPVYQKFRDVSECNSSELKLLTQDSVQLRDLWLQIQDPLRGIHFHNHRHRLMTYPSCVVASELVDWLIAEDKACSRLQAVAICQALTDSKYLEPVNSQEKVFLDEYSLYKPGTVGLRETSKSKVTSSTDYLEHQDQGQEPSWVKEIHQDAYGTGHDTDEYDELAQCSARDGFQRMNSSTSMFYVTLDADDNRVSLNRVPNEAHSKLESTDTSAACRSSNRLVQSAECSLQVTDDLTKNNIGDDLLNGALVGNLAPFQDPFEDSNIPIGWHSSTNLRHDNGEKLAYERLSLSYEQHETTLLSQLLSSNGLSQSWSETIVPLVRKVAETVRPDDRHDCDEMDIRQYVQFKKIPGGKRSECAIVNGVVFTKNVAHKNMRNNILNPAILLVRSPIVYQRQENKLLSMEPAVLQEHNYLRNVVAKIASFKPHIVLAEKTVSRVAQDFLLDLDITLVLNVKPSVLERVARLTQGEIVSSIDAQLIRPHLGVCHNFKLVSYTISCGVTKTLMFFDGCAQHLGCTVILRGASNQELLKVKLITEFLIYVYYNWRLERSFLMDEFAMPPPLPEEKSFGIIDEMDENSTTSMFQRSRGSFNIGNKSNKIGEIVAENDESDDDVIMMSEVVTSTTSKSLKHCLDVDVDRTLKERKCESQSIDDHSDPLRSYQLLSTSEEDTFFSNYQGNNQCLLQVSTLPLINRGFRKALDETMLSVSPNLKFSVPYLESEQGRRCKMRRYFPDEIYWSEQFHRPKVKSSSSLSTSSQTDSNVEVVGGVIEVGSYHPFTRLNLRTPITDYHIQESLADFRARGGRFSAVTHAADDLLPSMEVKKLTAPSIQMNISSNKEINSEGVVNQSYDSSNWADALDPFNHQRISVLFSSYSYFSFNSPYFCVSPWLVNMHFYDPNDISLGGFLEKYCFRTTYVCPSESCETPMTEHVRRFVHDNGCVHILLRKMKQPIRRWPDSISMWSWCHKCKQVTNVVPMSLDTWSLSFAKYLELRFHGGVYLRRGALDGCTHSLHHDHYQYFAYKQTVTAFKYSTILLREVVLPECVIVCVFVPAVEPLIEEVKNLSVKGHSVYGAILEKLFTLNSECIGTKHEQTISNLLNQLQVEKNVFKERMEDIQLKLTSPSIEIVDFAEAKNRLLTISDYLVNLKRLIAETVASWDKRFADVVQQRKKDEKASKPTLGTIKTISAQVGSSITSGLDSTVLESLRGSRRTIKDSTLSAIPLDDSLIGDGGGVEDEHFYSSTDDSKPSFAIESCDVDQSSHLGLLSINDFTSSPTSYSGKPARTNIPGSPMLGKSTDTTLESSECSDCEESHDAKSLDSNRFCGKNILSLAKQGEDYVDLSSARFEKKSTGSVKNMLSQFLSASNTYSLQNPFGPTEHYLLPRCEGYSLVVYEDEPSSIIAYALCSPDYELELQELRLATASVVGQQKPDSHNSSPNLKRKSNQRDSSSSITGLVDGGIASGGEGIQDPSELDAPTMQSSSTLDMERDKLNGKDKTGRHTKLLPLLPSHHVEVQFTDGIAKFYCRIYFAEQFCRLRRVVFPDGEVSFARSLSRCLDWTPMGGKSGCTFCITQDDRFILKQMTRFEVQSFEDFALDYIEYITKACTEQRPTALGKILGAYRIVYRNTQTNASSKLDLLVMENLFYGRKISQTFDLKGSLRNRMASSKVVLLDENLLRMNCEKPLYIRPHSKTVLSLAIDNDTQFLAQHLVMDYSLLVGIDDDTKELVCGIIDYIRTFTWDKKLETFVKSSGILGGQGKMPTVVSPELYRTRFCEAMDGYFLAVADRWSNLGIGIDCSQ